MNTIDVLLAVSFGFAIMWTAAWILRVIVMVVQKDGKVSAMQTIYMSFSWATFYFLLLQR